MVQEKENRSSSYEGLAALGIVVLVVLIFSVGLVLGKRLGSEGEGISSAATLPGPGEARPEWEAGLEVEPLVAPVRGALAPDFEYVDLDGNRGRLSDLRGKRVLINFWAFWCPPCVEELPRLRRYYLRYKDEYDFEILAISTSEESTEEQVREFVEEYQLPFPILYDLDRDVLALYGVNSFPTTFIVNRQGVIDDIFIGPLTMDDLRWYFGPGADERDFLREPPPTVRPGESVTIPEDVGGSEGGVKSAL